MTDSNSEQINESDLLVQPTIFITQDQYGNVRIGSNTDQLSAEATIMALELAKQKLIMEHYRAVAENIKEAQKNRPQILVPTPITSRPIRGE